MAELSLCPPINETLEVYNVAGGLWWYPVSLLFVNDSIQVVLEQYSFILQKHILATCTYYIMVGALNKSIFILEYLLKFFPLPLPFFVYSVLYINHRPAWFLPKTQPVIKPALITA